jgi:hypothetical protein
MLILGGRDLLTMTNATQLGLVTQRSKASHVQKKNLNHQKEG